MILEAWGGPHDGKTQELPAAMFSLGIVHIPMGPEPDPAMMGVDADPMTRILTFGIYECGIEVHPMDPDRRVIFNPEFWW